MINSERDALSLLEIAELVRGVSYKRDQAHNEPGPGRVPIVRANNIQDGRLNFDDLVYVPAARVSRAQRIRRGDIVLAMSSGSRDVVGKAALANSDWDGGFGAFCGVLRARPGTRPAWLGHFLQSPMYRAAIDEIATGTNINNLSKTTLAAVQVPNIEEGTQEQVAALLDRVVAHRTSCIAHLRSGRHAVERFRQAVLAAACAGRLTADWRSSMGREDGSGQPAGWSEATVASLAADVPRAIQSGPFGSNLKHSEFQTRGRLVIGIDNVLDGRFVLGRSHRISEAKFAELKKYEARPCDVLITVMATVGRVCVVPNDIEPSIITKHVYRITVDRERVLPFFLMHALRGHPEVREQIHTQTRGQTRPGINGQIVKGLVIALPPLDEQREIVRRVDQLLAMADGLRQRIDFASTRVDRSSQAILAKAFRGDFSMNGAANRPRAT